MECVLCAVAIELLCIVCVCVYKSGVHKSKAPGCSGH